MKSIDELIQYFWESHLESKDGNDQSASDIYLLAMHKTKELKANMEKQSEID